jgi:hypothetical protein
MSPRSTKLLSAAIFALLWIVAMLWWSGSRDLQTAIVTVIAGVITGVLCYLVFDKFNALFRT